MPMMRDNLISFTQRLTKVVDHGAQVRPRGQRRLALRQDRWPRFRRRSVPRGRERTGEPRLLLVMAGEQPPALLGERAPGVLVEAAGAGLGQRFLDLEHLLQQLGRRLRLLARALLRLPALLEANEVVDARDRIAKRPVGGVEPRRRRERLRLVFGARAGVEVRMVAPRQLVEPLLQRRGVDPQASLEPEYLEVIHPPPTG